MAGEETERLNELRDATQRRLHQLRLQKQTMGSQTPPYVLTEIAQAEKDLRVLEPVTDETVSDPVLAALRQFGVPGALANAIQAVESSLWELKREVRTERNVDREERGERQQNVDHTQEKIIERVERVELLQWLTVLVVVSLIVFILTSALR